MLFIKLDSDVIRSSFGRLIDHLASAIMVVLALHGSLNWTFNAQTKSSLASPFHVHSENSRLVS